MTCLFAFVFMPELMFAELSPTQIVIVSNENSNESQSVAAHYARKRGVPVSHIISVDTSTQETISREGYEQSIVQPIRKALEMKNLASTIRVIVTTYGIPLRVKAPRISPQEKTWVDDAKAWRTSSIEFLEELKNDIEQIAISESHVIPNHSQSSDFSHSKLDTRTIELFVQKVSQSIAQATRRIDQLEDSNNTRGSHHRVLEKVIQRINGLAGKSQILRGLSEKTVTPVDRSLTAIRTQLRSAEHLIALLQTNPSEKGRERAYQVVQEYFGVVGVLRFANQEIERLSYIRADASVDSELSLLWWDRALAHPSEKLPNPLYAWYPEHSQGQAPQIPLMMVSRLDAPTAELAKQLVDHAMLAEQNGLKGNAYFDARGMDSDRLLSYGHYDRDIRMLSEAVEKVSSYSVVLENTEARFSQSGDAPDVAVYVGWYRLRHYEDAFAFNPGSIGYHIASGEAVSLHDPIERGWCKNALERGITVTLGPIGEPYLDAFPLPTEFFGLLLTGKYSLVEAFYLSSRHVSWRMVLIGDPLYNPWRGKGLAQKVKASGMLRLQTFPVPPSERYFLDPVHARTALQEEREQALSRLSLGTTH